jgi:DNA replication protein DnaC
MEYLQKQLEMMENAVGYMHEKDGYDCELCKNKGLRFRIRGEEIVFRQCVCIKTRKSLYLLKESGIKKTAEEKTLDNFEVLDSWQRAMREKARAYIDEKSNKWFFVGGQSGCGKTHICTAICMELIKKGNSLIYMKWADATRELKNAMNDFYYDKIIDRYKDIDVLYIDDFFKVQAGTVPTSSDIRIAFEILNTRLLKNKKTIISSEFGLDEMLDFDEATVSRIFEQATPYTLNIDKDRKKNHRIKDLDF